MTQAPAAAHGSDTRVHKVTGDVHLMLVNKAGEVLFGQRQNTGYEDGAWQLESARVRWPWPAERFRILAGRDG